MLSDVEGLSYGIMKRSPRGTGVRAVPIAPLIFTDPYGKPVGICYDWFGSYDIGSLENQLINEK
jgi:hypothetical protein